ncbi:hypothetical protein K0M31_009402, partial [Melipona bicolor]
MPRVGITAEANTLVYRRSASLSDQNLWTNEAAFVSDDLSKHLVREYYKQQLPSSCTVFST